MKKIVLVVLLSSSLLFSFDFGAFVGSIFEVVSESKDSQTTQTELGEPTKTDSYLDSNTISDGLKEALRVGVEYATTTLGQKDGYLNNSLVKIEMPENLTKADSIIRSFGGGKYVDEFVESMNSAASEAAPQTIDIFLDAISDMTLDDAKGILNGDKNSATEYFKKATDGSLSKEILPIVQKSMKEYDVDSYYEGATGFYESNIKTKVDEYGLGEYLSSDVKDKDLDEYITDKTIDGLFKMIEKKEAEIREDPLAQTTSILKEVFGF